MRTRIRKFLSRLTLGLLGSWLFVSPQLTFAVNDSNDTYNISIDGTNVFALSTPGTGGFAGFDNPGSPGDYPAGGVTVIVNNVPLTVADGQTRFFEVTFIGSLDVVVESVNFNDNKNPPNQISGNYVEGLRGTLTSAGAFSGRYILSFQFTGGGNNPAGFVKTCSIEDVESGGGTVVTSSCAYHVQNSVINVPEPGTLAMLGLGLVLAAATTMRRRQR